MASHLPWLPFLLIASAFLASPRVLANGQTTHLWITEAALESLPQGELRDFIEAPELRPMLRNGTMFPDGGYPLGNGYAEIAHWEPFQGAYLEWIRARYSPPFTGEGAQHIAFLLGMASHGMADQFFDSLYMERCRVYDGYSNDWDPSLDTASDVVMAGLTGAQEVPETWVPWDTLVELYWDSAGFEVTADTLENGQTLLQLAVTWVGMAGADPDTVAEYQKPYPWAGYHLLDKTVPGSPPTEATVIALYWQELWDRLNGEDPWDPPLIATVPASGSYLHPRDHTSIESWVTVVFARGMESSTIESAAFEVKDENDALHPVSIHLFYGQSSHVVHLKPEEDWGEDRTYTVTVHPGPTSIDGQGLSQPWSFSFSTGEKPEEVEGDDDSSENPGEDEQGDSPHGCSQGREEGIPPGGLGILVAAGLSWRARRKRESPVSP